MADIRELDKSVTSDLIAHALACAPNECCGLVVKRGSEFGYVRAENLSDDPQHSFVMDKALITDNVAFIAHSHVNASAEPSDTDKVLSEKLGIPLVIVSVPDLTFRHYLPNGYAQPLEGRAFLYGVADCFSLAVDYYKQELGIELSDPGRCRPLWWEDPNETYRIEPGLEALGFVKVSGEPQPGDLILMRLQGLYANHIAVYLGNNIILHHYLKRPSIKEIYGSFWRKNTECIMRYKGVANVRQ